MAGSKDVIFQLHHVLIMSNVICMVCSVPAIVTRCRHHVDLAPSASSLWTAVLACLLNCFEPENCGSKWMVVASSACSKIKRMAEATPGNQASRALYLCVWAATEGPLLPAPMRRRWWGRLARLGGLFFFKFPSCQRSANRFGCYAPS